MNINSVDGTQGRPRMQTAFDSEAQSISGFGLIVASPDGSEKHGPRSG